MSYQLDPTDPVSSQSTTGWQQPSGGYHPQAPPGRHELARQHRPQQPQRPDSTRLVAAVLAVGITVVLCAVGGILLMDRIGGSTESPAETAEAFLTDVFVRKDVPSAMARVCDGRRESVQRKLDQVNQLPAAAGGGTLKVTWDEMRETVSEERAIVTVSAEMEITGGPVESTPVELWLFNLLEIDERWKVCGWA